MCAAVTWGIVWITWLCSGFGAILMSKLALDSMQSPLLVGLAQLASAGVIAHGILHWKYQEDLKRFNSSDIALMVKMALIHVGIMLLFNVFLQLCPIQIAEQIRFMEPIASVVVGYIAYQRRQESSFTMVQIGMLLPLISGLTILLVTYASSSYIIPGVAMGIMAHFVANIYNQLCKKLDRDISVSVNKAAILLNIHRYAGIFQTFFVLVVNIPHVYPHYHNPRGQNGAQGLLSYKASGLLLASGLAFATFTLVNLYCQSVFRPVVCTCMNMLRGLLLIAYAVFAQEEMFSSRDALTTALCVVGYGLFYQTFNNYQTCCRDAILTKQSLDAPPPIKNASPPTRSPPLSNISMHQLEENSDDDDDDGFEMIEKAEYFEHRSRLVK